MKIIAVIQARMGSTRLPGKSIMEISGRTVLEYVLMRVSQAKTLHKIILAIPSGAENDPLCSVAQLHNISVYRGSEDDVLSRYVEVALATDADIVVRVCADNPLVDPGEIDRIVKHHIICSADYSFNNIPTETNNYPDGLGVEVVNAAILYEIAGKSLTPAQKEHVTQYILDHPEEFRIESPVAPVEICGPEIKLDINTEADFLRMRQFIEFLPPENGPFWSSVEIVREYRNFFQPKIVVLVETPGDVVAYQNFAQHAKGIITVIATTPQASWDLEIKKIPYNSLDTYYNENIIYAAGIKIYQPLFRFCQHVDAKLSDQNGSIRKYGLCPASDNFPLIKILHDVLLVRSIVLHEIINKEKPELIVTFGMIEPKKLLKNEALFPFEDDDNIYQHLLRLEGWPSRSLHLSRANQTDGVQRSDNISTPLKGKIVLHCAQKWIRLLIQSCYKLIRNIKNFIYLAKNNIYGGKTLLIIGCGYDWNNLIPILRRKGYQIQIVSHPSSNVIDTSEPNQNHFSTDITTDLCSWEKINFSQLFNEKLGHILRNSIANADAISEIWEQVICKVKPSAVLAGAGLSFSDHIPRHIARSHNIPVLSWQHGGIVHIGAPMLFFEEHRNCDIHLCWGPGVLEWIKTDPRNYFKTPAFAVGSYDLEKMYFSRYTPQRDFSALYVTTSYDGNKNYVSIPCARSDTSLWNTQQKIIKVLGESHKKVKIRLHPSSLNNQIIQDFVKSHDYKNLNSDIDEDTYINLVNRSDVIILDWPSTTLLQAIALRKTVFVFLKHIKLSDEAVKKLEKRAYCSDDIDEFAEMIRCYISNEPLRQKPDIENTEFLEMYGTSLLDGHVANRALEILDRVTKPDH